jgi:hypothetical protein
MKSKKIYCLQLMMGWHDSGYRIEELEAWFSNQSMQLINCCLVNP